MARYRSAEWRKNIGDGNRKHGQVKTPAYWSWINMRRRCNDPRCAQYRNYGARGITVAPEWADSFNRFFADMGQPPTPAHSLGRIDNDRGYSRANCEWQTPRQQLRNTRANVQVTAFGETKVLQDWATDPRCVVRYQTAWRRIQRMKWDHQRALTTPAIYKDQSYRRTNVPA